MNKLNKQGKREGYWEEYYSKGKLMYKGNYIDGERDGV
jgi:antitoxin component YwqK of YwqJK toxin-antitoxin module